MTVSSPSSSCRPPELPEHPVVVGIAGPTCSGKSSLARRLVHALPPPACVLPLDAYYRDHPDMDAGRRADLNFDHPDALEWPLVLAHVRALAGGETIQRPSYDFETHRRLAHKTAVHPGRFLVVEGLHALYWPPLRALYDLSVFVDVGDDVAVRRRLRRDTTERGRTPLSVCRQFARHVQPMYHRFVLPARASADLVLDGERPVERLVEQVLSRLRSLTPAAHR